MSELKQLASLVSPPKDRAERSDQVHQLSRAQLAIVLEGIADGITVLDPAARLVYANDETETKKQNIQDIIESVSKLDIGICVVQNDAQNKPRLKYFNAKFKALYGFDDQKLNSAETFKDFISLEDVSYIEKLYIARQEGQTIPNLYRVDIKTAFGIKHVQLGIIIGLYENKLASYCCIIEIPQEELKTPKEIFNALT